MITIHSEDHRLRAPTTELSGGLLVPPYECAERVDRILEAIGQSELGEVRPPDAHGLGPVTRIHDAGYLAFLETAWADWQAAGYPGEAIPITWPARRMAQRPPRDIDGKLGYYAMAADTSISAGTWQAAQASANVALTGAALVAGGSRSAFALCRPPGHHAARDLYGGYCFLNNAAIAAQYLRDEGAARVAVLDVDFHHGNGTQDIFYHRGDVLFISIHGAPEQAFPHFLGYADETGHGPGEGANLNLPLPRATGWPDWSAALVAAIGSIRDIGADALVMSFGADTYAGDPISFFRLQTDDFTRMGAEIGKIGLPTLFVMEGGYAVDALGWNTVNTLRGFEEGA